MIEHTYCGDFCCTESKKDKRIKSKLLKRQKEALDVRKIMKLHIDFRMYLERVLRPDQLALFGA